MFDRIIDVITALAAKLSSAGQPLDVQRLAGCG